MVTISQKANETQPKEKQKNIPPIPMNGHAKHETPASTIASEWLTSFERACSTLTNATPNDRDAALEQVASLFLANGWWRDALCLSWDYRTHEGTSNIKEFLSQNDRLAKAGFSEFTIDSNSSLGGPLKKTLPYEKAIPLDIVEFSFRFKVASPPGKARAMVRLSRTPEDEEEWKAYVLYTALESIDGYEPSDSPPYGHYEGHTKTWEDVRAEEIASIESDPTVVVVGGGTGGLMMAMRLRDIGIKVLVLERNANVGDTWRNRYDLLTLNVSHV